MAWRSSPSRPTVSPKPPPDRSGRHQESAIALCDKHRQLSQEKDDIEARRVAVRVRLDEYTSAVVRPYERSINAYLEAFNAGFAITETSHSYPGGVATSSYQLVINNTAIDVGDSRTPASQPSFKNTLSAGDRT